MPTQILLGDGYRTLANGDLRDQFVLFEGRRGTGKTRAILSIILTRALKYPKSRWLLTRSTRTRLTESVLNTLEEQVFPSFGMQVPGGAGRENRHSYSLPNGSTLIPMGLDDIGRTQSVETAGLYVAEASEIDDISVVVALAGAMRQDIPGLPVHQCIVDINPCEPGFWANQIAEDVSKGIRRVASKADYVRLLELSERPAPPGRWKRCITCLADNPHFWDVDNWCITPAGTRYLATLGYLNAHLRKRWIDGEWTAAEGSVFPEFDEERNVCAPFPNGWPKDWPVWIGYDPGYAHPCAVVFYGLAPNGQPHVIDEIHGSEIDLDRLAPMIRAKAAQYHVVRWLDDPYGANQRRQESNGQTVRTIMRDKHRLFFHPWQAAEGAGKQSQVEAVRLLLIDPTKPLQVWNTCPGVIREFQSWSYKKSADGSLKSGDDAYEDRDNDAMDALMGIVAEHPRFEQASITIMNARKRGPAADDDD